MAWKISWPPLILWQHSHDTNPTHVCKTEVPLTITTRLTKPYSRKLNPHTYDEKNLQSHKKWKSERRWLSY